MATLNFGKADFEGKSDEEIVEKIISNPSFHAFCVMKGDRFVHYLLPEDFDTVAKAINRISPNAEYRQPN